MPSPARTKQYLTLSLGLLFSHQSIAIEPAAIAIGEMNLYPSITVATGHDDNILATETDKISSWVTRITPNLLLEAENANVLMRVSYALEKGMVHDNNQDNYLDHNFNTSINYFANSRNRFDLQAAFIKGHEARGEEEGGSTITTATPLEFDLTSVQGTYTYGREEAKAQIQFRSQYQDKNFTNYDSITDTRNYDQVDLSAQFKYRLTGKTSAIATVTSSDIDYDNSNKDSVKLRYLVGATWDATAKTSGTVQVGWSDKNFKDASLTDTDGGTWDAQISWEPRTYSTFTFSSSQDFGESTTADSYVDTKTYAVDWQHYWKDSLKSTIAVSTTTDNYSNSARKDKTDTLLLGLNYEAKRWLNLGVGYTLIDTDSNTSDISFKKQTIIFTVQTSL